MDYDLFIKQGKELGYVGEELQNFVTQKVDIELEREKNAQERKERQAQRELEKEKLENIKAVELEKLQNDKLKMQYEHELEMSHNANGNTSLTEAAPLYNPSKSRLPVYDENKDNMESFIERFERWAKSRKLPDDSWALELSLLLQGKALDVYTRMDSEKALDYKSLKLALMESFRLTAEGFRQKFRNARPEKGENPSQFVVRISSFLNKWFEIAKVTTLEQVVEFLSGNSF
jgi:hypothetical protein